MDNHTPEQRRKNMQSVKNKDSKIEILLRKELWARGLRYQKNVTSITGKNKIFMAAAKLNLAKCVSVEPVLTDGGELEYSKRLFEEVLSVPNLEMDEEQDVKDVEKNQNEATKAKVRKV